MSASRLQTRREPGASSAPRTTVPPGDGRRAAEAHAPTTIRRAGTPGGLTPADALRLQRAVGNSAVAGMLGLGGPGPRPRVQRYHTLDPEIDDEPYTTPRFTGTNTVFPASQQSSVTFQDDTLTYATKSADKGYWGALPPLRVSDGNEMAIEEEAGKEQKVFFASEKVLASSRQRLKDVRSGVTIAATGVTISVPDDEEETHKLKQVKPHPADDEQAAFRNASSICNQAANEVFNQSGAVEKILLGIAGDHAVSNTPEARKAIASGVTVNQPAQALADSVENPPGADVDTDLRDEFLVLFPGADRIVPEFVAAYADRATPGAARSEIVVRLRDWDPGVQRNWYRNANFPENDLAALVDEAQQNVPIPLDRIVGRHKDFAGLAAYAARDDRDDRSFGVNAFAAPDVGEAYATFSVSPEDFGSSQVDVTAQSVGIATLLGVLSNRNTATVNAVDQALAALRNGAPKTWTWHYAAVVARDGDDRVTLENYNRDQEDVSVLERETRNLLGARDEIEDIVAQVKDWIQTKDATLADPSTLQNNLQYIQQAEEALEALDIAIRSDVEAPGDRWFFQMYGPVKSQPGAGDDQSFHRAWARPGEFSNPLTVRLGAEADDNYREEMVTEVGRRIDGALWAWQGETKRRLKDDYATRIRAAATRGEVARLAEQAVAAAKAQATF